MFLRYIHQEKKSIPVVGTYVMHLVLVQYCSWNIPKLVETCAWNTSLNILIHALCQVSLFQYHNSPLYASSFPIDISLILASNILWFILWTHIQIVHTCRPSTLAVLPHLQCFHTWFLGCSSTVSIQVEIPYAICFKKADSNPLKSVLL